MGVTLKEITVHTTNSKWQKEFFDRTKEQNQEKPVYKILSIVKFGLYWRTNEDQFIALNCQEEDDRLLEMKSKFSDEDDLISEYANYYLLHPIILSMRLKQIISSVMLEKEAEYQISLEVDEFSILL